MANKQRGDVEITIDGKKHVMRITLGALATLETALGVARAGELDEIINAPTYSQLVLMTATLINFREGADVITEEAVIRSDLTWRPAWIGIAEAVKASNPPPLPVADDEDEGEAGNGDAPKGSGET